MSCTSQALVWILWVDLIGHIRAKRSVFFLFCRRGLETERNGTTVEICANAKSKTEVDHKDEGRLSCHAADMRLLCSPSGHDKEEGDRNDLMIWTWG